MIHQANSLQNRILAQEIQPETKGIFATNIYNKYANLYSYLGGNKGWVDSEREEFINCFDLNGERFKFQLLYLSNNC